MKCIEDEIPFEAPEGWAWARLGSIFSTLTGSTPATKDKSLYGEEYPFYKPADLNGGFMITDSIDHVSEKGYLSGRIVVPDTVLVTCIGATIGKTGIIRNAGICNQQINAILPRSEINTEYVYFLMCSKYEQNQIYVNASATTLPLLNKSQFDKLLVPIPPIMAQVAIVKVIINLLNYVDLLEEDKIKLTSSIGSVKSKILDLAIRGKLVPQDPNDEPASVLLERIRAEKEELIKQGKIKRDKNESVIYKGDDNSYYEKFSNGTQICIDEEIPFDIPKSWQWTRLSTLAQYRKGPFGSSLTKAIFIPETTTAVKVYEQKNAICKDANLGNYYISQEKFESMRSFEVFPNDIIVSCAGTIGETFLMPNNMKKGIINQALMKISLYDLNLLQFYLVYFDFMLKGMANEQGYGNALKNIPPFDILKKYLIPTPPINEQKAIVSKICNLFSIVDSIEQSLS
ncbi:restriction endonuclease subunit S [Campylobacter hyointestinalis]|uniref:restriction endonuclease subunit S n=1 Tax=Campylobacter hyointestinalis TaxID=198 RepID=UPI0015E20BF3|nr:restriction endonuclease subunit S [Campylobacter hyointestinalis]